MKVILSLDGVAPPLAGIGQYSLHIARGLLKHPAIEKAKFFSAYQWNDDPEFALHANQPISHARRWIPCKTLALHLYTYARRTLFRFQARHFRDYLLHVPSYLLLPFDGPSITNIHDLSHIHYPHFHPKERISLLRHHLPRTLEQASLVITGSDFIRQEIIDILGVAKNRVVTIYNGVDAAFRPHNRAESNSVLATFGLEHNRYLLVVNTLEPRKNLLRLVSAYARLAPELRKLYPLVLAGANGWLTDELEKCVKPLEAQGTVRRLGYVSQVDLPSLYSGARAFAFPSLYEGFGFPVLEAMASGIPVLTSNRSSLPELAGNAALLIDPEDVEQMTVSLEQLLTDSEWRGFAVKAGIQQAKKFSWQRCVNETVEHYRRVLNR